MTNYSIGAPRELLQHHGSYWFTTFSQPLRGSCEPPPGATGMQTRRFCDAHRNTPRAHIYGVSYVQGGVVVYGRPPPVRYTLSIYMGGIPHRYPSL
jgi:hypothetical protein